MPTLSHMARVCRGAAGSILPSHSRRKKEKKRVSKSLLFLSIGLWFFFITFCFFQLRWSYFFFFLFPFFSISGLLCFRSRNLFFCGSPAGKPLGGASLFRLTGCQVDPSASIRWLGGPNTIDERMTPVYSILISRIGFSFSCCCWIGKGKEIFTDFIYTAPSSPTGCLFLAISYREVTVYHNKKKRILQ
jgi:hypothetical protein